MTSHHDTTITGNRTCSICSDEHEKIIFHCPTSKCKYQLCLPCIRKNFEEEDSNGKDWSNCSSSCVCPLCNHPTSMGMISAACGPGVMKAVELNLSSSIKSELRATMAKEKETKPGNFLNKIIVSLKKHLLKLHEQHLLSRE